MKKLIIVAAFAALATGCVNTTNLVKALSKDPATAHVRVNSIYFTIEVDRTNPNTNTLPHAVKDGVVIVGARKDAP